METLKLNSKNFKEINRKVVGLIKRGKIIVYPTDTVYGLICDAKNENAVQKIFKIKKRNYKKPIPVFVRDMKMAKKIAFIGNQEEEFLKSAWPGKTTVILKPKRKFIKGIGKPKKEIGLRIPKYKPLNYLLGKINCPLAQTSANISGEVNPDSVKEILRQFKDKNYQPDLIINGGILSRKPSMIINLTKTLPKILRK